MWFEEVVSDVTVVGGGLAGVCAAVAAARTGSSVALIQNRPVLGGNSSSEIRVWVCGATAHGVQKYARETGIMGELYVENQYRNPLGNPVYWDQLVLDLVKSEPNIQLFLNTDVRGVQAHGPEQNRTITSVTGWVMASEREIKFHSPMFLDTSGDGLVGHLAGAHYRIGREAAEEFDEVWAPATADDELLGSSMFFYTKDLHRPVKYVPPSYAKDITQTPIPEHRIIRTGDDGCHYWWIEWGGELDTVRQNETIRDELWAAISGIWDYIKNSGNFDSETLALEWMGSVPGKREYRRFIGDHVLTQNDVMNQVEFEDAVAFGGWSIDLHPKGGMYAEEPGADQRHPSGIYQIPLRSLYSSNVSNLFFAGRNISATHIAFGSSRVMATCAVLGEAIGTAASLCVERSWSPRELARDHVGILHNRLARTDASLIGVAVEDEDDKARTASITSSSTLTVLELEPEDSQDDLPPFALERDVAVVLPVNPSIESLDILVSATEETNLYVDMYSTARGQIYLPDQLVDSAAIPILSGESQWVSVPISWTPEEPRNAFVLVHADPRLSLFIAKNRLPGVLCLTHLEAPGDEGKLMFHDTNKVSHWSAKTMRRKNWCFKMHGPSAAYAPKQVSGKYQRPFAGPNMWASEQTGGAEEWLRLDWGEEVALTEINLVFDDDVDEYLINLHYLETPFDIVPELIKDYRIELLKGASWETVLEVRNNRRRHRLHKFTEPQQTSSLCLVIDSTNGAPAAHVVSLKVFN